MYFYHTNSLFLTCLIFTTKNQKLISIFKLRLLGGPLGPPPSETEARPGAPPPGGGNQSWLTASSTQSVVIRYLTDKKGQPNQLREGTEWHRMAWHGMEWHGMTWHGIGSNYTYKEILNALKTKGRCKDIIPPPPSHRAGRLNQSWLTANIWFHSECGTEGGV